MLTLQRKVKESIRIDGNIEVRLLSCRGDSAKLGIVAPPGVPVFREEIATPENCPEFVRLDAFCYGLRRLLPTDMKLLARPEQARDLFGNRQVHRLVVEYPPGNRGHVGIQCQVAPGSDLERLHEILALIRTYMSNQHPESEAGKVLADLLTFALRIAHTHKTA